MAELKIRRGSVDLELVDDNGKRFHHTWQDAYLDPEKKLKVKYYKSERDVEADVPADCEL